MNDLRSEVLDEMDILVDQIEDLTLSKPGKGFNDLPGGESSCLAGALS